MMHTSPSLGATGFKDPLKAEENRKKFEREMDMRSQK